MTKVKRAILMLGAFESWQYCKRYTQFWFLIIGDLNLDMPLCIVATDLNRIAFHIDSHNTDKVKRAILMLGSFESSQYCKRYTQFLIPDHWGLKLGHAVMHCSDRFEQNRFQHRSPQYRQRWNGPFWCLAHSNRRNTARDILSFDSWSLGT